MQISSICALIGQAWHLKESYRETSKESHISFGLLFRHIINLSHINLSVNRVRGRLNIITPHYGIQRLFGNFIFSKRNGTVISIKLAYGERNRA